MGLPRPSRQIGDRSSTLPLGRGLLIDPEALGQRPQALLTMLYRSTDRLSRRGAPVQNLAHSASFESLNKDAPSKAGTKQLDGRADGFSSPDFDGPANCWRARRGPVSRRNRNRTTLRRRANEFP